MRIFALLVLLLILLLVAASLYVRFAPLDAEALHVDPNEVVPPPTPNFALLAGTSGSYVGAEPAEVAGRIAAVAAADGARVLAGSVEAGHVTYVVRSTIMGFPDIVSVRLSPEGPGTQVDLYSRSVYGGSDLGVNTERAQRWMQAARGATVFGDGD